MSIVSIEFILFILAIVLIYYIIPPKYQWVIILIANFFFYSFAGLKNIIFMIVIAFIIYITAIAIDRISIKYRDIANTVTDSKERKLLNRVKNRKKKIVLAVGTMSSMSIWIVLKYTDFIIENINHIIMGISHQNGLTYFNFLLPLGISFYVFDAVGYLIDVYRDKYSAEYNPLRFFTYVSFFPHIIQGPFDRYDVLGKSLFEEHRFSYDQLTVGATRILWGLFKKLIIADKLATPVNNVFANYSEYAGYELVIGILIYGLQLYADFSGYTDIIEGVCTILGVKISENFNQPYFARTVDEFWRRWHISLGAWFRDYVFYPVSMGSFAQKMGKTARKKWGAKAGKLIPGYFALIFVWTATGLWHGAHWTYVVWGLLNLLIIIITMQLEDQYNLIKMKLHINAEGAIWTSFCIIRTYIIISFFRFFSITDSMIDSFGMLNRIVCCFNDGKGQGFLDNMSETQLVMVIFGTVLLIIYDYLKEKDKWKSICAKCPVFIQNGVIILLLFSIILFAGGENDLTGGFMYANF